jgi:hypothetical protein
MALDDSSLLGDFEAGVLYFIFSDQKRVEFCSENVWAFAKEYLDSPEHIPDHVRKAVHFQRCRVCPELNEPGYCHALYPYLAIFDAVDRYPSYEKVQVFYLDPVSNYLSVKKTSLQNALQYVAILSVINYCEIGRQYKDYFFLVTPLMKISEIAWRVYLNAFWLFNGDKEKTTAQLKKFADVLEITIHCQVKRLGLISKNDSIVNAFILTHVLTDMLHRNMDESLKDGFEAFKHRMM